MTSTYTPGAEVARAMVELFRGDATFCNAPAVGNSGGLLFPTSAPRIDAEDWRVWSNHVEMPKNKAAVLAQLPRLLLDITWRPHDYEQEQAGILHGPVSVWLHVLAPREEEEYGERIVAAAMLLLLSTRLSSARIIAGDLTATSDVVKERLTAFNSAWEWRAGFRSANVGVLL